MAGISIITNFNINAFAPIDSRLVATNSIMRNNIQYKYNGLKVYVQEEKKTYTWDGTTWTPEGNGIYGGSGSLIGDTVVNTGTVSTNTTPSYKFSFGSTTSTTNSFNFTNYFYRNTSATDVEWRNEYLIGTNVASYQYFGDNTIKMGLGANQRFTINPDDSVSVWNNSGFSGKIRAYALTSNQTYNLPILPTGNGTFAMIDDIFGAVPKLQAVTTNGATTSVGIRMMNSYLSIQSNQYASTAPGAFRTVTYFGPTSMGVGHTDYFNENTWGVRLESFNNTAAGNRISFKMGPYSTYVYGSNIMNNQDIRFPNKSGIVRLEGGTDVGFSLGLYNSTADGYVIPTSNSFVSLSNPGASVYKVVLPVINNTIDSIAKPGSIIVIDVTKGKWSIDSVTPISNRGAYINSNSDSLSSGSINLPIGITRFIAAYVTTSGYAGWVKW